MSEAKLKDDVRFGEALVKLDFCSSDAVRRARTQQSMLWKQGKFRRLCNFLFDARAVTHEEAERAFEEIGKLYRFCPQCSQRLGLRPEQVGATISCGRCGNKFPAKDFKAEPAPRREQAAPAQAVAGAGGPRPARDAAEQLTGEQAPPAEPKVSRRTMQVVRGSRQLPQDIDWDSLKEVEGYAILGILGEGGMGRVYKAKHGFTERIVALKVMKPEEEIAAGGSESADYVGRFMREVKIAARLDHPNIVRLYDAGEWRGLRYMAMEYVAGQDLWSIIEDKGPVSPDMAARILREMASALDYASEFGLVHRDIKPMNILISLDGVSKLTDLGLAKAQVGSSALLTRVGQTFGTLAFMSPEQLEDAHSVDVRSDIFSLGGTIYIAVTGQLPFAGQNEMDMIRRITQMDVEPPRKKRRGISRALSNVIVRMLEKDPARRYRSAGELFQALKSV